MKNLKRFFLLSLFFHLILFSSCSKEENNNIEKTTIFENGTIVISYETDDSNVTFYFDALYDLTNAINGTWPDLDLYRVFFDKNNNGVIDSGVDFLISPNTPGICYATLITQTSNSGCTYFDDLTGSENFGTTENLNQDHAYYQLTVPKNLFSADSKVNFTVHVRDSETNWSYYPATRDPILFESTYEITW